MVYVYLIIILFTARLLNDKSSSLFLLFAAQNKQTLSLCSKHTERRRKEFVYLK